MSIFSASGEGWVLKADGSARFWDVATNGRWTLRDRDGHCFGPSCERWRSISRHRSGATQPQGSELSLLLQGSSIQPIDLKLPRRSDIVWRLPESTRNRRPHCLR
jgi:hypothetical protein